MSEKAQKTLDALEGYFTTYESFDLDKGWHFSFSKDKDIVIDYDTGEVIYSAGAISVTALVKLGIPVASDIVIDKFDSTKFVSRGMASKERVVTDQQLYDYYGIVLQGSEMDSEGMAGVVEKKRIPKDMATV